MRRGGEGRDGVGGRVWRDRGWWRRGERETIDKGEGRDGVGGVKKEEKERTGKRRGEAGKGKNGRETRKDRASKSIIYSKKERE